MTSLAAVLLALLVVWVRPTGQVELVQHARDAGGAELVLRHAHLLEVAARRHHVDPDLLAALDVHESGARHVESRWGVGPLQVNPRHRLATGGRCCTVDTPGCLEWNLDAGAKLFAESLAQCPDEWSAIGHYRYGWACLRRERDLEVLATRIEFLAARCAQERAARWSRTSECGSVDGLRSELAKFRGMVSRPRRPTPAKQRPKRGGRAFLGVLAKGKV